MIIKSTNEPQKEIDGGHETITICLDKVDAEAYYNGGRVKKYSTSGAGTPKDIGTRGERRRELGREEIGNDWDDENRGLTYLVFKCFSKAQSLGKT